MIVSIVVTVYYSNRNTISTVYHYSNLVWILQYCFNGRPSLVSFAVLHYRNAQIFCLETVYTTVILTVTIHVNLYIYYCSIPVTTVIIFLLSFLLSFFLYFFFISINRQHYKTTVTLLQIKLTGTELCLTLAKHETAAAKRRGAQMGVERCSVVKKMQRWARTDQQEFRMGKRLCLDANKKLRLMKCHGEGAFQEWKLKVRFTMRFLGVI